MESNDGAKPEQANNAPPNPTIHVEFAGEGSAQFSFTMVGVSPGQLHALVGHMEEFARIMTQQQIMDSMSKSNLGGIVLPGGPRMPPGMRPR